MIFYLVNEIKTIISIYATLLGFKLQLFYDKTQ